MLKATISGESFLAIGRSEIPHWQVHLLRAAPTSHPTPSTHHSTPDTHHLTLSTQDATSNTQQVGLNLLLVGVTWVRRKVHAAFTEAHTQHIQAITEEGVLLRQARASAAAQMARGLWSIWSIK